MSDPQVSKLDNGLTVVTLEHSTKQPFIALTVGAGSRDETEAQAGISHFLEHMLASDTVTQDEKTRARLLKRMRGVMNAETSHEDTVYYYQVNEDYLTNGMRMLAEGIQTPLMTDEKVERERGAILAELRSAFSDPDQIKQNLFMGAAFAGSSLDRDIGGSLENVSRISKDDLNSYRDQYYTADNMVLTVASDISHEEICEMAAELFQDLPRSQDPTQRKEAAPAHYRGGYAVHNAKHSDEIDLSIGFPVDGGEDVHGKALNLLLSTIIAGDFDSKLMNALRTDSGMVYQVAADVEVFRGCGFFEINTGMDKGNAREVMQILCSELRNASTSITQEEMDDVRDMIAGEVERSENMIESRAIRASKHLVHYGEITTIAKMVEALDSITLEELQEHAAKVFSGVPTVAAYGNGVKKLPSYEEITEWLGERRKLDASGLAKETAPSAAKEINKASVSAVPSQSHERAR